VWQAGAIPEQEPSVFGRYAAQWFGPMVAVLVGGLNRQPAEQGIHYFLLDACFTFLGWPALFPTPPGGPQGPAGQLLRYLVRGSFLAQRGAFSAFSMQEPRWAAAALPGGHSPLGLAWSFLVL
jgi:hypothetical protein